MRRGCSLVRHARQRGTRCRKTAVRGRSGSAKSNCRPGKGAGWQASRQGCGGTTSHLGVTVLARSARRARFPKRLEDESVHNRPGLSPIVPSLANPGQRAGRIVLRLACHPVSKTSRLPALRRLGLDLLHLARLHGFWRRAASMLIKPPLVAGCAPAAAAMQQDRALRLQEEVVAWRARYRQEHGGDPQAADIPADISERWLPALLRISCGACAGVARVQGL